MTDTDAIVAAIHEHVEHMRGYTLPALAPGFLDGYGHALGLVERDAGFIADAIVAAVTARAHARIRALADADEPLTRFGYVRTDDLLAALGPAAATQHDQVPVVDDAMVETRDYDPTTQAEYLKRLQAEKGWEAVAWYVHRLIADHRAAQHAATLAPILALADRIDRHPNSGGIVFTNELRAACSLDAADTHNRAVRAQEGNDHDD